MLDRRKVRWAVLLPLVAITTIGLIGAAHPRELRACEVAEVWVKSHLTELPTTLGEFRSYSVLYQHAIYASLSRPVRIALWEEQLTPYLRPDAGLTPTQRKLVRHVLTELDSLVGDPTGRSGRALLAREHLVDRLVSAFGQERYAAMFHVIGGRQGAARLVNATRLGGPNAAALTFCDCTLGDGPTQCIEQYGPNGGACGASAPEDECFSMIEPTCGEFHDAPCTAVCSGNA